MDTIDPSLPGVWTSVKHELPPLIEGCNYSAFVQICIAVDESPYPTQVELDKGQVRYVTRYKSGVGYLKCRQGQLDPSRPDGHEWIGTLSLQPIDGVAFWAPMMEGPADLVLIGKEARQQHWLQPGPHHVLSAASKRLAVWFGAMPESNGRTNWTVMLLPEGGKLWDGVTIARSEYKEQMRYAADRLRYLIGELAVEPDPCDYDGNILHPVAQDVPASEPPRWMGDEQLLRRLRSALGSAGHLYDSCGAESTEEGWCVRIQNQLELAITEIERRLASAKRWNEDEPLSRAGPVQVDWDALEIDYPDVDDLAHSATQEALSFGLSHDVIRRHMDGVAKATEKAVKAALLAAGHLKTPDASGSTSTS